jgi:diacylglycerol kinase
MSPLRSESYPLLKSFKYAFGGLVEGFSERNVRIHAIVTVLVVIAGFTVHLSLSEWASIVSVIGMVFMGEFFNTAVELLCDLFVLQYHPKVGLVKDIAAAGVFIASLVAAIVGGLIFVPKILLLLQVN